MLLGIIAVNSMAVQAVLTRNVFFAPADQPDKLAPYLEVYWQVDPNSILYNKEEGLWKGKIQTDLVISNEQGIVAQDHYILATRPLSDAVAVMNQKIIDIKRYALKPGTYSLQLKLTDLQKKGNDYQYEDTVHITEYARTAFFSDVQLLDTVVNGEGYENSMFQRNNLLQFPLCTNFIDDNRKQVKYYAELYGTNTLERPLIRKVFIARKDFRSPSSSRIINTDTIQPGLLTITMGKLSVASLPSGNYYLNMVIEDSTQQIVAGKSLFFQLVNTNPVAFKAPEHDSSLTDQSPVYLDINKTFLSKYSPAQIRAILKMLLPIADPNERRGIGEFEHKPDDTYSRYFIYNFWLSRNKLNPEAEWKQYAEKVKQVNKLFGSSMLRGYETDRGIVYLKYGPPTDRIRVENETGALPYEVWQYNIIGHQANGFFLFYKAGIVSNDYRILHTTIDGEIRNKAWRSALYINGTSGSTNSAAEQYLGNK